MSTRDLVYFNNYITRKTREIHEQKARCFLHKLLNLSIRLSPTRLFTQSLQRITGKKIHPLHYWPVRFLNVSFLNL